MIVLVAVAALLLFATTALAKAPNAGPAYIPWSSVATLPGNPPSPHGGYSTSTVKCGVCHSVHQAQAPDSEILLASSVADACIYCHVGGAGGYTQVYGGNPANYSGTDLPNAHNYFPGVPSGQDPGVSCATCHQVHASDAQMTDNAYLTTKLLRGDKTYSAWPSPNYDPVAQAPLSTDDSRTALTKWCAGCHFTKGGAYTYYSDGYNQSSHIMTTATATYSNPVANYTGQVAWLNSTYCSSCHASDFQTANWPHMTQGNRFLTSADGATGTPTGATNSQQDGVCLRCHKQGLAGVGLTF